jgi:hypothetical protein
MNLFTLLQAKFAPIFTHTQQAEMLLLPDQKAAYFYARLVIQLNKEKYDESL